MGNKNLTPLHRSLCRLPALLLLLLLAAGPLGAQNITINVQQASIKTILKEIQSQATYRFVYNDALVEMETITSLTVENEPLESVLKKLFEDKNILYEVKENQIILFPGKQDPTKAQTQMVRGVVIDQQDDQPLQGATVTVKGNTRKFAITGADGRFELADVDVNAVLIISFIGYQSIEVPVANRATLLVEMRPEPTALEAAVVVVTGYTTISKERATGSYNVVKSDLIEKSHSSNLSTALLGTTAGMQGKENADGSIDFTIRGVTSLYADAKPLVVVDGFPVANGFTDINPNDVESVTVLKDAAAASIWGARSANGVIVVTTKRAKERFSVNVNAMISIGQKIDLSTALITASAADQVAWERMAYENKWYMYTYTDSFNDLAAPYSLAKELLFHQTAGKISLEQMNAGLQKLSNSDNRQQIKDYLLQNPILQQYNITLASPGSRMQNYVSLQYEHGQGNMISNGLDRWRLNHNTQASIFKWLDFSLVTNLHYLQSENSGPTMGELRLLSPYELILNDDGSYATQLMGVNREQYEKIRGTLPYDDWDYNILRETRARKLTGVDISARIQAGLTFKLLPGLTFDTKFQYEYNMGKTRNHYLEDSYYVRDWVNFIVDYDQITKTVNRQFVPKGGILQTTDQLDRNYSWRNQINYNRTFRDKHAISFLAGTEVSEYRMERTNNPWIWGYDETTNRMAPLPFGGRTVSGGVQLKNIMGTNLAQFDTSGSGAMWYVDQRVGSPKSRQQSSVSNTDASSLGYRNDRYVSVYANASYTYADKYSVSGSVRSDASNLITDNPKYRWAPLWSVGGLWHISREDFMYEASDWLNRLSLRLTYGENGNVEKSTSPLTLIGMTQTPALTTGTYTGSIANYGNPYLRWERTATLNAGIDFSLFHGLLFGSIDVYDKVGKDILGTIALPSMSGTTTQRINQAGISNRGFEVELGVNKSFASTGITLSTTVTYAYNKNKITNLFNPNNSTSTVSYGVAFVEGYPIGAMWSYIYAGMKDGMPQLGRSNGEVYPMTGTAIMTSVLSDGYLVYSGPTISPHSAGWYGTVSGYGFGLSFLLIGNFGGKLRNPTFNYPLLTLGKDPIPMFVNEVINGSPNIPSWPAANVTDFSTWSYYIPYLNTLVEDSSFIKLKELTLDYKLPARSIERIGVSNFSLFAQVRDLGCLWVANSRGYDPEWMPGTLPPTTTYVLGLNINF